MKRYLSLLLIAALLLTGVVGCGQKAKQTSDPDQQEKAPDQVETFEDEDHEGVRIHLFDDGITVDGEAVTNDASAAVYVANDIVYYESGKDFTYGEGTEADAHTKEEADAHTVVHIAKAGQYVLSGHLSKGQVAVDLGEDAEEDPDAVVTLVLDGVDITCRVAPAVIFYNVYECGEKEEDTATKDVDLTAAGARVILANNSENYVNGSYVARIYKPETVELTEDGTEVADAKKLHKYDGAFYSKMSMRIQGGNQGDGNGKLIIKAENEGLDSELHLTIDGGDIEIESGNDGINTNEDNVSVTTINGGKLSILVNGSTGEGDGIDSNGWLVINGGTVLTQACAFSGDAGIDADLGIHIFGGTVIASGNMMDRIEDGGQTYAVFTLRQSRKDSTIRLKNAENQVVAEHGITNSYTYLIISSPDLIPGEYTLWDGDTQLQASNGQGGGMGHGGALDGQRPERPDGAEDGRYPGHQGQLPEGMEPPADGKFPEGGEVPEGMEPPADGERPEGGEVPEGMEPPADGEFPEGGEVPEGAENMAPVDENTASVFTIAEGANYFQIA